MDFSQFSVSQSSLLTFGTRTSSSLSLRPDEGYYFTGKLRGKTKLKFKQNSDESTDDNGGVDDSFKDNRWLGDVNKILKHGASCKSLT